MKYIHIQWDKRRSIESLKEIPKLDQPQDRGLYQIYGDHPVYGSDCLLYIGQTEAQTFVRRIGQHRWDLEEREITFHAGRLAGDSTPLPEAWSEQILEAEKLLIQAHRPAYNAREISQPLDKKLFKVHVLNWGDRRALLPEVSGAFWSQRFHNWPGYKPYGEH